jgi:RecA/RadA recombinase
MHEDIEMVKKLLKKKRVRNPEAPAEDYLSTGVALLNLALTGTTERGIHKGNYVYFVGDRSSGKTWFSINILAEARLNPTFAQHRLILDDAENGSLMDIRHFFGKLADKLEPPRGTKEDPIYSKTTEDFYFHLDDALNAGPCIYVLDSMDALNTQDDIDKFAETKAARRAGKEAKGTYGMAQARINSRYIKPFASRLRETGSILIVISQTRDKINTPFPMRTHAGGKALGFFAHVEIWTKVVGSIKKTVRGKPRIISKVIQLDVQKNRQNGWDDYNIEVPHSRKLGLDDLGASVDYLVDEKHWKKADKGNKITAPEFDFEGDRESLVELIQSEGGQEELNQIVTKVWKEIEDACTIKRVNKYNQQE